MLDRAWLQMNGYDILTEYVTPGGFVQDVPVWFRDCWRMTCIVALKRVLMSPAGSLDAGRA